MTCHAISSPSLAALLVAGATLLAPGHGALATETARPHVGAFSSQSDPARQGAVASQSQRPTGPVAVVSPAPHRPRVGLVLAGGGAKGGAHVGVLKVLEQMHVPIDCIAGTSMGALVGGGYASGIPAAEMQKFLVGINWPKVIGGVGLREMAPIEQKAAGVTYSNNLDLGLRDGKVIVPGGLVNTSGIDDLLRSYVAKARSQADFDKLPIPYRAVATDMVSGQMVVLGSGDLATAMRASMAIPGFFAPVHLDNYILNDGGMVRNLPVDVARDLCADVVIVVNLVTQPTTPDKLQTATQLAGRAMDVMLEANVQLQLQTLKPGDVLIDVQMGDIGTADFERVPDTIPLGEAAARAAAGELAKYAVPPEQYAAWRAHVTSGQEIDARVADVQIEGLEWMNPAYLETRSKIHAGDQVDNQRISDQAREMSALRDMESVGYQLTGDPKNPTLQWLPKEKNWGPNFLQFDLGLYATAGNDSGFVLYMKTDRRWLNSLGLQWRNEIQLGTNSILSTSLYQPLDVAQVFFVEPKAFFTRAYENLYVSQERIANYRFDDLGGAMDLGVNFGTRAQLRLGYLYTNRDVTVDTGSPALGNVHATDAGIVSQAIYDTRDTAFNPTNGIVGAIEYMRSGTSLGADRDWERIEAGLGIAVPVKGDIIWVTAAGGTAFNSNLPVDRDFAIGGPGSFPGLALDAVRAPEYWTLNGSYLWKLKDIESIRGQALYAGVRLETGEIDQWSDSKGLQPIYGGSIYIAGRTMVGPLTIGLGGTSLNTWSLWLAVGRPVGQGTILEKGIFR
jgi:NTE family protein